MAIRIVTDSASDLPVALESANDVIVVSAYVIIGNETCAAALESQYPGLHIYQLYGGQPHYHYLASLEYTRE